MATYLILNCIVLLIVYLAIRKHTVPLGKTWLITFGALFLLTAIFDTLMISAEFFSYPETKILGIYIGKAPIEDFFYPLASALLIPAVWSKLGKDNAHKD